MVVLWSLSNLGVGRELHTSLLMGKSASLEP